MTRFATFVLGLLAGWVIEWIIDWVYWRRRQAALQAELDQAKARLATAVPGSAALEGQLATLKGQLAGLEADKAALNQQLTVLADEKSSLAAQLASCQAALSAERSHVAAEAPGMPLPVAPAPAVAIEEPQTVRMVEPVSIEPDDLILIKGIGPVINRKLNEAGIYTFRQLADLTPARLREIVGDVIQRLADEEEILAEARERAVKKESGV